MGIVDATPRTLFPTAAPLRARGRRAHGERLAAEGTGFWMSGRLDPARRERVTADEASPGRFHHRRARRRVALPISVDTSKARVAAAAIAEGASMVNDVWGFQQDREMARVVADTGAAAALMHNRATVDPGLDIMADILDFLSRSIDIALAAGVAQERLWVDPGFGFGKTPAQNLQLIRRLRELAALGRPVLLGVSRKSTIGIVTGQKAPAERVAGSIAAGLVGVMNGAAILRVHDVRAHVQAFICCTP